MNGISNQIVDEFNSMLESKGSIIRLYSRDSVVDIYLVKDNYLKMEEQIINPSKEFYEELISYFQNKGIEINFNNTGSCFWGTIR